MRAPLALVLLSVAACSDTGTREQLTVVVEADRTRALADQARLAEMQRALADAQQEMAATRKDLTDLREKLMKAGALSADEVRRLEEREAKLMSREDVLGAPASSDTLTRADVDALLRAHEERLRGTLGTASAPPATGVAPTPPVDARDDTAAQLAALKRLRAERGLRDDDVEGGPALQAKVDEALAQKRGADALEALGALRARTEATTVNAALVKRKYAKASARLEVLSPASKDLAKRLLGEANTKNAKGDAAGANAALNQVLDLR